MAEDGGIGRIADGLIGEAIKRHTSVEALWAIHHHICSAMLPGRCWEHQPFAIAAIFAIEKKINQITAGLVDIGKQTQKRPRQVSYGLAGEVRQKRLPRKS